MLFRFWNGGFIDIEEFCLLFLKWCCFVLIIEDDCLCVIGKLKKLGGGYEVFSVGCCKFVWLVFMELNRDYNLIF